MLNGYTRQIGALVMGVIALVIGMVLGSTVLSQAASLGSDTNAGSFSGFQDVNDLVPLAFAAGLLVFAVAMFIGGGAGILGYGPMRNE